MKKNYHLPKPLNTQILTAILSKDSKDATYKYALLRAMVQCVVDQSPHRKEAGLAALSERFGEQFEQEIFQGLGTGLENDMNDAIHALKNKSEYLIAKQGFQKFEI